MLTDMAICSKSYIDAITTAKPFREHGISVSIFCGKISKQIDKARKVSSRVFVLEGDRLRKVKKKTDVGSIALVEAFFNAH